MTCAAMGLLLRVSYDLDRAQRQVARLRGDAMQSSDGVPATSQPLPPRSASGKPVAPAPVAATRGTSRLRQRIEPVIGRLG